MKKLYKLITLLLVLIILVIILLKILNVTKVKYSIKKDNKVFEINQEYNNKYYIYITYKNKKYPFYLYLKKDSTKKIITDVYYKKTDNYECLLPIINNKVKVDMLCYKDDILYRYKSIKGLDSELDDYINTIKGYNIIKNIEAKQKYGIQYYKNNINKNIAITTYKGLIINDKKIDLFNNDVYENNLSIFIDNYYIVADYSKKYEFNDFYIVDLKTNKVSKIHSKYDISYDSFIQGTFDNKVYFIDNDSNVQYEIDIANKNVNISSKGNTIKYCIQNSCEYIDLNKSNKNKSFEKYEKVNYYIGYDKQYIVGDYYYLFKKTDKNFELYRVMKDNDKVIEYIVNVPTTNIYFGEIYFYYIDNDTLKYYDEYAGIIKLIKYDEFKYNNTIKYYVY